MPKNVPVTAPLHPVVYARCVGSDGHAFEVWGEAALVREFAPRGRSYEILTEEQWHAMWTVSDRDDDLFDGLWADAKATAESKANGGAANREGQVATSALQVFCSNGQETVTRQIYLFRHLKDWQRAYVKLSNLDRLRTYTNTLPRPLNSGYHA
jgi:hypothetical protein